MENWEKKALENHNQIVAQFEKAKSGDKGEYLLEGSLALRIAAHVLELGGDVSLTEIIEDTGKTKGKEWTFILPGKTECIIADLVDQLVAPGTHAAKEIEQISNSLASAGGIGLPTYALKEKAREADIKNTLVKKGDSYYLWCQYSVDWYAKMEYLKKKIEQAEQEASRIGMLKLEVGCSEEELQKLEMELKSVSPFRVFATSKLKERIDQAKYDLEPKRQALKSALNAEVMLPSLRVELEAAEEECKRQYA